MFTEHLLSEKHQKATVSLKTLYVKISSSQNDQYLSTRRQNNFKSFFLSPVSCAMTLTIFSSRKFYIQHFLGTHDTLPTLSHTQNIVM